MGFRQNKKEPRVRWLQTHRHALASAGVPFSVLDDARTWNYVLLHGADHHGTGWDPSWISDTQAASLLALLLEFYTEDDDLVADLTRRLTQTRSSEPTS